MADPDSATDQREDSLLSDEETRSIEGYLSSDETEVPEPAPISAVHMTHSTPQVSQTGLQIKQVFGSKSSEKSGGESVPIRPDIKDSRKNHRRHFHKKRRTLEEFLSFPDQIVDGNRVVEWDNSEKPQMQERIVEDFVQLGQQKVNPGTHKTSFQMENSQSPFYVTLQNIFLNEKQHADDLAEIIKAKGEMLSVLGRHSSTALFEKLVEIQLIQGWLLLVIEGWQKTKEDALEDLIDKILRRQEKLIQYANILPPVLEQLKAKRDQSKTSSLAQTKIDLVQKPMTWITQSIENIKRLKSLYDANDSDFEKLTIAEEDLFGASSDLVYFSSKLRDQSEPMKSSLVVEIKKPPSRDRRLRTLFLFDKVLASAHQRVILLRKHFTEGDEGKISENLDIFYDNESASVSSKTTTDLSSLKMNARSIGRYELKWFVPLDQLLSLSKDGVAFDDEMLRERLTNIEDLKSKIKETRAELHEERRAVQNESKMQKLKAPKIHRLRSCLYELQAQLVLQAPKLPLFVNCADDRVFCILLNTERERMDWMQAIQQAKSALDAQSAREKNMAPKKSTTFRSITSHLRPTTKATGLEGSNRLSGSDVSYLINHCKSTVPLNRLGAILISGNALSGLLQVTVHEIDALEVVSSYYVSIEVDYFGQLELVAKTRSVPDSANPIFNQTFMIELDSSQLVSFSIYRKNAVVAQLQLSLDPETIEQYVDKIHTIRTFEPTPRLITMKISLSYKEKSEAFVRNHSLKKSSIFGQPLADVLNRDQLRSEKLHNMLSANQSDSGVVTEKKKVSDAALVSVPIFVTACVEEIERRGLHDEGIYRICGSSSSITYLKEKFDQDMKMALKQMEDCDISVVSSLLKQFFRELPEPLIDRASFLDFVNAMDIEDDTVKGKAFGKIIRKLQPAPQNTFMYLINHLITVSSQEETNKMHIGNLALVWAMTLFQSTMTTSGDSGCSAIQATKNLNSAASESFLQTQLLHQILRLHQSGLLNLDYTNL